MKRIKSKDIVVSVNPVVNPHWDYRVDVMHPEVSTICTELISGGAPIIDAAISMLRREMVDLISSLA